MCYDVLLNAGIADEDVGNMDLPVLRDLGLGESFGKREICYCRDGDGFSGRVRREGVALWALDLSSAYRMLAEARSKWWLQQHFVCGQTACEGRIDVCSAQSP